MTKYIIQIEQNEPYPFDSPKTSHFQFTVRVTFPLTSPQQTLSFFQNLNKLTTIDCPHIVNIQRVLERKGKSFVIDYQYVPDSLSKHIKQSDGIALNNIKQKIVQLCLLLTQNHIKITLKVEDFGLMSDGTLKMYIPPTFQTTSEEHEIVWQEYVAQIQRLFEVPNCNKHSIKAPSELSDYSYRLDKKITEIQHKINRRKRKKSKGTSSPDRQNSSDKDKKPTTSQPIDAKSAKHSNDSNTSERTRYSTIQMNQMIKPKHHRASFNDFSTPNRKQNESTRQDSLKKRFQKALEKTQQAFKVYDRHLKRHRRF